MENFVVSARKYRPSTFNSVVGQKGITATLKNALSGGKLGHAYLFTGPRGVGKTTCARIFAKTINCQNLTHEHEPCNTCESCASFNENRSYNIHELDAASNNSVEDIRALTEKVRIKPQLGKYSVYIIDEVHMLSTAAFNAFLKTLEEPPEHAIFILATTEKHKILPTILSRCQIFDFNRITVEDAADHLAYVARSEGVEADSEALNIIAQKADGGMRDALSMFDQIVSFAGKHITYQAAIENLNVLDYDYYFRVVDAALAGDISQSLLLFDKVLEKGFDGHHFITGLSSHLRDVLVCKDPATLQLLQVAESTREKYRLQAQSCELPFLFRALDISNRCDLSYKAAQNKRLQVELALMQICQLRMQLSEVQTTAQPTQQATRAPQAQQHVVSRPNAQSEQVAKPGTVPTQAPGEVSGSVNTSQANNQVQASQPENVSPAATSETTRNTTRRSSLISTRLDAHPQNQAEESSAVNEAPVQQSAVTPEVSNELQPFTEQQLHAAWQNFANQYVDSPRLRTVFDTNKPKLLDDYEVEVGLTNKLQLQQLTSLLEQLQHFLRRELRNGRLRINLKQLAEEQTEKKMYTNDDKLKFLEEKNPTVSQLKSKFNLDFI